MILIRKSLKLAIFCYTLIFLVQSVPAFAVGSGSVNPSGNLYPGNSVNASYMVYAASGTPFSAYDDLQFITELDGASWTYAVMVNGVTNTRPVSRGKILTINGYELEYPSLDEVVVTVNLQGTIPAGSVLGTNTTIVKIQELDARGYAIPSSIVNVDHLIGEPTPPPTPAYGSITVTSSPSGADIYIDNVYKGLSPAVFNPIPNGNHIVLIKLDGYPDFSKGVTVAADNQTVDAALSKETSAIKTTNSPGQTSIAGTGTPFPGPTAPAKGYGSLSITTIPAGALVYVDGTMMGVTPTTIPMITEGPHSINLIMDGYQDLTTTITINTGTTSEYITGLAKTTKSPGFAAGIAVISIGLLSLFRKMRK
jgi:hypothetical protein